MTFRMNRVIIASLSAVTLMLAANETFARSGAAPRAGFAPTHSFSRPFAGRALRHHRRNGVIVAPFWPLVGDDYYSYGPNGEPFGEMTPPTSGEMHYTYTNDVPWDWAHRFPPIVTPSDRPYVPSCPAETVTVPGRDGQDRTVNVIRCY